jgi:GTP-binding protein
VVGIDDESFVVADIPGLIEGAHRGAGLGLQFLRHVARTLLLIHVIDAAATEGRDPLEDFRRINEELGQYSPDLAQRPQLVAANKMDLPEARERWPRLREALAAQGVSAYPISAATREGVEALLRAAAARLAEIRREMAERAAPAQAAPDFAFSPDHRLYTPLAQSREFAVEQVGDHEFEVRGAAAERAVAMTDLANAEGFRFLQTRLRQMGIAAALERAGAQPGDTVRIGDFEMAWLATPEPPKRRRTARERKTGIRRR